MGFMGVVRFADYVNLFVKLLKFTNINVTNEYICIQLDTPGSFEFIKNKLFLTRLLENFIHRIVLKPPSNFLNIKISKFQN